MSAATSLWRYQAGAWGSSAGSEASAAALPAASQASPSVPPLGQDRLRFAHTRRPLAGAGDHDTGIDAAGAAARPQQHRDRHEREIPLAARGLLKAPAGAVGERRNPDLGQQLVRRERRLHRPREEFACRHGAGAARTLRSHLGVQHQHYRRKLGRRVVVGEAASYGAAVANLRVRDVADCLGQQGPAARHAVIGLDRRLPRHRPDAERSILDRDTAERSDAVEIDQNGRPRQAEVEQWHQALPAGKRPRVGAVRGQQGDGVCHLGRALIGERRWLHDLARPGCRS